jgi:hypothetical protein
MPQPTSSNTSAASPAIRQAKRPFLAATSRLARAMTPARCYCLAIGLFLLIRGAGTVTGGAGYGLPGDGWRAILQLVLATVLLAATARRTSARTAVIVVGLIYAVQTVLAIDMHDVLGVIPVDGRDHIVHPALAVLALVAVLTTRRGSPDPQTHTQHTAPPRVSCLTALTRGLRRR